MSFLQPRVCLLFFSVVLFCCFTTPALSQISINYTSMMEVDETNDISISSDCITFTDIETRHRHSFVYKTHTTQNDFIYEFDTIITSSDTFSGETVIWGITNTGNETFDDWDAGATLGWYKAGSSTFRLELEDHSGATDNSNNLTFGVRYYIRVKREGSVLSAQIFSDQARTNLVETLTRNFETTSFAFLYGLSMDDATSSGKKATGDVCHLTYTEEGGAPADTISPSIPSNVQLSNATHTTLDATWDASSDNVGVTDYVIDVATDNAFSNMVAGYINKSVGNTTQYTVADLQSDSMYFFRVRAADAAANVSANGVTVNLSTTSAPSGGGSNIMKPIDFTWMSEVDESSEIDVNSDCIIFNNIETRALDSFVYQNFKTRGDFIYEMDAVISDSDTFSGETAIWGISNTANETYDDWSGGAQLSFYKSGSIFRLELENKYNNSADNSTVLQLNQRYYMRVKREDSTLTAEIYDDASRTNLIDTLTRSFNTDDFNFLYGFSVEDATVTNWKATGNVCQLQVDEDTYYTNFTKPTEFVKNIVYNQHGQITSLEYGNGVVSQYTYNELNLRLERMHTIDPQGVDIQDLRYTYDGVGNIITITDFVHTANQTFRYDELNRLKSAQGEIYGSKTYLYDEIGNLLEKDGKSYLYGEGPAGPHAVTSILDNGNNTTFTYDDNGNMATKQKGADITFYEFDVENRLKQVKINNDIIADYQYDGDGGRTNKTSYGSTIQQTQYVGSLFEQTNDQGLKNIYLGNQRIAAIREDNTIRYYHNDHLGGANVLTDEDGVKQEVIEYKPFGEFARHDMFGTGQTVANFYFTSQLFDQETQLYYYNARYYDPVIGRFISADEIVSRAGNPATLNLYSYVGNNPIMRVDPSGHIFGFIFAAAKALVSFAIAHPVVTGALIGGVSGGVAAHRNGGNVFSGIGFGTLQGGTAGFTFGIAAGTQGIGSGLGLLKSSAAVSLTSQVADAVGQEGFAQGLRYGATALSAAYVGLNVGIGIKDWATSKLSVTDLAGNLSAFQSNDNIYVNGILSEIDDAKIQAAKFNQINNAGITKIAHNPTSGFIADMTESFLQKITFTSSVDRQLASMVKGLNNITFTAHSQGTLITGNALLNLGLSDNRNIVTNSINFSSPLSQPRAFLSAAIGGTSGSASYGNNWGDPINLIGPNINPAKFISGTTFQFRNH